VIFWKEDKGINGRSGKNECDPVTTLFYPEAEGFYFLRNIRKYLQDQVQLFLLISCLAYTSYKMSVDPYQTLRHHIKKDTLHSYLSENPQISLSLFRGWAHSIPNATFGCPMVQ
jgi:hypothetical protein